MKVTTSKMSSPAVLANGHLDRLINEKSIKVIEELHVRPRLKENFELTQIKLSKLGALTYLKPMIEENQDSVIETTESKGDDHLEVEKSLAELSVPGTCEREHDNLADCDGEASDSILINKESVNDCSTKTKINEFQTELYSLLTSYKDLLYTNESVENMADIQQSYVLHVLGHLISSRSKIISNNKVFNKKTPSDRVIQDDPILRDQGYTRARALIMVPFRHSALRLGKCIVENLKDTHDIKNLNRFILEFGDQDGLDTTTMPVECDGSKPSDYYQTFHGNVDDSFRVGLKITKKSLKFFTDFYESDIIIASPLGLKTLITLDENRLIDASKRHDDQVPISADKDFLSSIEIVILDQAEIFLMQNWEHLIDIMQHVNIMPTKPRSMDISRVRLWHLENWSKYYRQLIMFSSITVPLVHSFFQTYSFNYEGYLTFKHRVEHPQAKQVTTKCTQHFLYYNSPDAKESCDTRFNFFIKHVLPKYTGSVGYNDSGDAKNGPLDHTLIFVSSYFDYVRLRNYFRREKLSFTQICEYTESNKTSKARQLFYFGARQFLIYTERCHFYHRYKIKGVRNIIFYEPPMFSRFYTEMLELLTPELQGKKFVENSASQFSSTTLFSNHDTLQLGAIIGFNNAVKLIQNKKSIT